jgi:hypothetical protein
MNPPLGYFRTNIFLEQNVCCLMENPRWPVWRLKKRFFKNIN